MHAQVKKQSSKLSLSAETGAVARRDWSGILTRVGGGRATDARLRKPSVSARPRTRDGVHDQRGHDQQQPEIVDQSAGCICGSLSTSTFMWGAVKN